MKSVNFRSLWWLVAREAYCRIMEHALTDEGMRLRRNVVARRSLDALRGTAERWMVRFPSWRYYP